MRDFQNDTAVHYPLGTLIAYGPTASRATKLVAASPDPRFREVVRLFAEAGFLESEKDEFHPQAV